MDATTKKAEANRRNAQRSTGPRTPEGKALASRNALKHGLTAREVVTVGERPEDFEAFRAGLVARLAPVGELEAELAERIAASAWRLRRVVRLEALMLSNPRTYLPGLEEEEPFILRAWSRWRDSLEQVGRYERTIEGGLYRALHELQRLQAARAGAGAPLPVAVDVTVGEGGAG
jgi:hypothetical protein